jgi:hypothetical protein
VKPTPLDELNWEKFCGAINTRFRIRLNAATTLEVELTEATPSPASVPRTYSGITSTPRHESFSLVFCGPQDRPLAQGTYRFEHDQLGAFDLFIVPIAPAAQGRQYQAVFNRLVSSA